MKPRIPGRFFEGQDITHISPNKRPLNTVFQKYALFTHMSIAENIAFGLKIKNKSKDYIQDKIKYALKLVNLDGYENRSVESFPADSSSASPSPAPLSTNPSFFFWTNP